MKYQKARLVYLSEATATIQGVNPGQGKIFSMRDGVAGSQANSTVGAYPITEEE